MLTPKGYKQRIADENIDRLMEIYGAVCIEGPKWCGKTWTSRNHSVSASYIGDPAGNFMNKQLAETDPSLVLDGKYPRLIDEWQLVPPIWDAVKYKVDETSEKGKFVLTGSSTPIMKGEYHGGSGRIGKYKMRTMSLYESGQSTGAVSLESLFNSTFKQVVCGEIKLDSLIDFVVRGGWPGSQSLSVKGAMQIPIDYLNNVPDDMERMDGKKRDLKKVMALLRSLGRNESTTASKATLKRDIEEFPDDMDLPEISDKTIADYLDCFERLFIVEDQPAFGTKLRSSVKALKSPKRHFVDPSLAVAAIGATKEMLKKDLNTFGYFFEALCVRDLRIYADYHEAKVYHYRDENDKEADAIVQMPDGSWGMFEIKVGFNQVESAANELINLSETFKKESNSSPEFLCVICGMSNAAYRRPDGVYVIPITALKP